MKAGLTVRLKPDVDDSDGRVIDVDMIGEAAIEMIAPPVAMTMAEAARSRKNTPPPSRLLRGLRFFFNVTTHTSYALLKDGVVVAENKNMRNRVNFSLRQFPPEDPDAINALMRRADTHARHFRNHRPHRRVGCLSGGISVNKAKGIALMRLSFPS